MRVPVPTFSCRLNLAVLFLVAGVGSGGAFPIEHSDEPHCDFLAVPASVVEIGSGPAIGGPFPPGDSLDALDLGFGSPACPASNDPFLGDPVVAILNTSGRAFGEVWYVADAATTLSNWDGRVGTSPGPASLLTFKIDDSGDNQPLTLESLDADGIWQPGEVWYFVIQDFANASGIGPASFGSLGLDSAAGSPSSASIIAVPLPDSELPPVDAYLEWVGSGRQVMGVHFQTDLGFQYVVEWSPDLEDWRHLSTVHGDGADAVVEDADAGSDPARFYHVIISVDSPP